MHSYYLQIGWFYKFISDKVNDNIINTGVSQKKFVCTKIILNNF